MIEKSLYILSIDDKTMTSDLDRAAYKKMGVVMLNANSFQQANQQLAKHAIDVLVINLDFHGVDPHALLQHYKATEETSHIPIVITSIREKPKGFKKLVEGGMDLFVEQPMPRQFFIEKIRFLLDQKVREDDRLDYEGDVSFVLGNSRLMCPVKDLSKTGLLFVTEERLPTETEIQLEFQIPGNKKPIKVKGEIVREIQNVEERTGYGVRFHSFVGDSQKRLERYIDRKNKGDPKLVYYL